MRYYDEDEAKRLNAEPWQLDLLKVNPDYVSWGPHEDYMATTGGGWSSPVILASWADFGPWGLNELNECVNFYFQVSRASEQCPTCGGNGYHPEAQRVVNTFYPHQCEGIGVSRHEAWNDKITQDEVQALVDGGRLHGFTEVFVPGEGWKRKDPPVVPTAEEVNAWQQGSKVSGGGFGHDAINRGILIRARLKRLGLPDTCPTCDGHGDVFTEPAAHVSLVLWMLHPRKGCSRGVEVSRIEPSDLPAVRAFLTEAAARNAERFSRLAGI